MNSPSYCSEHASALAADWARVPLPETPEIAAQLDSAGRTIAALLDCSVDATAEVRKILGSEEYSRIAVVQRADGRPLSAADLRVTVPYFGAAPGRFMSTEEGVGNLWINEDVFLANVPIKAWRYELGGYQAIKKWLGYRHFSRNDGRALSWDEQSWLRNIVLRLTALMMLEPMLDELYEISSKNAIMFDFCSDSSLAAE